jgi:orotidine-5'-phosphate decarboxylase
VGSEMCIRDRHSTGYRVGRTIIAFNREIVEATADIVCAYKINVAFYEAHGTEGIRALRRTIAIIRTVAPNVPIILDAKRADIGNTNAGYVSAAFSFFLADAITVHPYLGAEALQPFLEQKDKGIIVLCRTSNPGAGEFQDLRVNGEPLYQVVARRVANEWNRNGNCALVVGATYPEELYQVRRLAGDIPILIPGIGAQGGDVEKTVTAGKDNRGQGMIINSSRGIIFASKGADFAEAARRETAKLRDLINQYR